MFSAAPRYGSAAAGCRALGLAVGQRMRRAVRNHQPLALARSRGLFVHVADGLIGVEAGAIKPHRSEFN